MNKTMGVISGLGIGAGLMYLFDLDRGNRRPARVRNRIQHVTNKSLAQAVIARDENSMNKMLVGSD